jgi:LacI family transcriptional regulator
VARAAGVSGTSVSLAFQPRSRIATATREKILAVARKMGYLPNLAARALRQGSPKSIGFLVNGIANPFYAFLVQNADLIARHRGYQIVVADAQWDAEREAELVENLISSRVRGVIACSNEKNPRTFEALAECNVPCIVVDTVPQDYRGGFVANDVAAAGRLAAEHLREVRCRRLALLTAGPQMDSFSAMVQLRKGFLDAVNQWGMDPKRVCIVPAGLTIDGGRLGFQRLAKRAPDCDGVLCVNDLCALGAIEAADALGIRVGPDVAIMGVDDDEISSTSRISLTSIRQPSQRMIDLAVNAIIDRIENQECPEVTMLLAPELIVRNSTRRMSATAGREET